jgi:hypothetical protein
MAPERSRPGVPRPRSWFGLAAGLLVLGLALSARADEWKYDVVVLKDNTVLKGLLVDYSDGARDVELRAIIRKPGQRTRIETYFYKRADIESVEPLSGEERAVLEARIKALDVTGKELAERIRRLEFEKIDFGRGRRNGFRYEGTHFTLESNVQEELFRRCAVRLAQVFNAYARYLPPHYDAPRPLTILLAGTQADYQALLRERGITLFNPAFYDPARNQIVCGSDLDQLGAQLEQARKDNRKVLDDLKAREAELNRLYKGKVPREVLRPITDTRQQLAHAAEENDKLFARATRALLQRLYHESFHAYLANFVYRADREEMPRWLNEGLAQIFETALFEGDEVRIGHADAERLKRAREALAADGLVPLKELLRSGPKQFLVAHASDKETSDRYYLTSWALASYLAFDRKILNTPELDAYCRAAHEKEDPLAAFAVLVGTKPSGLVQLDKDFRSYVQHLRPNGSVARPH